VVCLTYAEKAFPTSTPAVPLLWAVGGNADRPPFGLRVNVEG
jgi:hypothetical protein